MSSEFLEAAEKVKYLKSRPPDQELFDIYGLYQQATEGDISSPQPWTVQYEARHKWDAWHAVKGMSREDAERKYIEKANYLIATYN